MPTDQELLQQQILSTEQERENLSRRLAQEQNRSERVAIARDIDDLNRRLTILRASSSVQESQQLEVQSRLIATRSQISQGVQERLRRELGKEEAKKVINSGQLTDVQAQKLSAQTLGVLGVKQIQSKQQGYLPEGIMSKPTTSQQKNEFNGREFILKGGTKVARTPQEARQIAEKILPSSRETQGDVKGFNGREFILGGGTKVASTPQEALEIAQKIFTDKGIQVSGGNENEAPTYRAPTKTEQALGLSLSPELRNRTVDEVRRIIDNAPEDVQSNSLPPLLMNQTTSRFLLDESARRTGALLSEQIVGTTVDNLADGSEVDQGGIFYKQGEINGIEYVDVEGGYQESNAQKAITLAEDLFGIKQGESGVVYVPTSELGSTKNSRANFFENYVIARDIHGGVSVFGSLAKSFISASEQFGKVTGLNDIVPNVNVNPITGVNIKLEKSKGQIVTLNDVPIYVTKGQAIRYGADILQGGFFLESPAGATRAQIAKAGLVKDADINFIVRSQARDRQVYAQVENIAENFKVGKLTSKQTGSRIYNVDIPAGEGSIPLKIAEVYKNNRLAFAGADKYNNIRILGESISGKKGGAITRFIIETPTNKKGLSNINFYEVLEKSKRAGNLQRQNLFIEGARSNIKLKKSIELIRVSKKQADVIFNMPSALFKKGEYTRFSKSPFTKLDYSKAQPFIKSKTVNFKFLNRLKLSETMKQKGEFIGSGLSTDVRYSGISKGISENIDTSLPSKSIKIKFGEQGISKSKREIVSLGRNIKAKGKSVYGFEPVITKTKVTQRTSLEKTFAQPSVNIPSPIGKAIQETMQRDITSPVSKGKSLSSLGTGIKQNIKIVSKQKRNVRTSEKINTLQTSMPKVNQISFLSYASASKYKQNIKTKQDLKLSSPQKTREAQRTIQTISPRLQQRQQQRQQQRTKLRTIVKNKPLDFSIRTPRPRPVKKLMSNIIISSKQGQFQTPKEFIVSVRREGKFRPVGSTRSISKASSIGQYITANSLGASFKVSGKGAFNIPTPQGYYKKYSKKEGLVFIEQPRFRLSTPSEKLEIKLAKRSR